MGQEQEYARSPYFAGIDYDGKDIKGENRTSKQNRGNASHGSGPKGAGCVPTNMKNPYGPGAEYVKPSGKQSPSSEEY